MSKNDLQLGPLEMEVLGVFNEGQALSVSDIQNTLKKKGKDLAYTTVMTVLGRLHGKGHLTRGKEGRQFLYSAAKEGAKTKGKILSKVRKSLFGTQGLKPILALLDSESELTSEELKELRKAVDEKIKQSGAHK